MSAEKNVVEAARAVVKESIYLQRHRSLCPIRATLINNLESALSAYDSAPAPSEDRVRDAAEAAIIAWSGGESDPKRWPKATRDIMDAIRRYVTPAPALPAGTVAVSVETLRDVLYHIQIADNTGGSALKTLPIIAAKIRALLPPPPRPEPPMDLVAEWERKATKYVRELMLGGPDATFLEHSPHVMRAYVAALRAAWEAEKGNQ